MILWEERETADGYNTEFSVFSPLKMNFNILGNAVPHLHAHILPRFHGDPAPHRPIDPNAGQRLLTPEEYKERLQLIRSALSYP